MSAVFKKLNLKDQAEVVLVNAPASFEGEVAALVDVTVVRDVKSPKSITFVLSFVTTLADIEALTKTIAKKAAGDAVVWFAYPKGSSKRYTCAFNRDTGWDALGAAGFEPVRQVAIDEDWSALRFRRVEHIKTMTRSFAMTAQGKRKAARSRAGREVPGA
jgi:hypothetical protein